MIVTTTPLGPPLEEPITVDHLIALARLDRRDEDDLLPGFISAARQQFELDTDRSVVSRPWRASVVDVVQGGLVALPWPPLQSVTTVTGYDAAGGATVIDPALYWIVPAADGVWLPTGWSIWTIDYVAGVAAADVPPVTVRAIGSLAAHYATAGRDLVGTGTDVLPMGYQEAVDRVRRVTVC